MKTARCYLLARIVSLSVCVMSSVQNERNADRSPAAIALYPSEAVQVDFWIK
ncbi:MAG: hypothetical protein JNM24_13355 [Bdellovibrionaceae bacterium]|nr:hypothetical protein [Pseudobdellovibrionaceae bacterium]